MEGLGSWLAGAGIQSHDLEQVLLLVHGSCYVRPLLRVCTGNRQHTTPVPVQEFASGYLFAKLLQVHSLQPDLHAFKNKGKPDAYLNNYARLQVRWRGQSVHAQ
jgi:hypothetical protein